MSTVRLASRLGLFAALVGCGATGSAAPPDAAGGAGAGVAGHVGDVAGAGVDAAAGVGGSAGAAGVGAAGTGGDAGAPPRISGPPAAGSAFVHLFEWRWTDIAAECESYLGPAGFAGVQISPPSEHAVLARSPWWERYQTVSYALDQSRSGTAAEFAAMVRRCAQVGVGIYVDAVLNHMTGQAAGTGSHGTKFTKYEYPGLFTAADFHQPPCGINDADYADAPDRVRVCELVGLADLNTASESVRDKLAAYLNALVDLGVAGFRLDASKHMYPADVDAIIGRVNQHAGAGHAPFFFLEVIDDGAEAIHAGDYLTVGASSGQAASITDFQYRALFDKFVGAGGGSLSDLKALATSTRPLPSAQAVVFATNHDTERAAAIFYQDGAAYDLATVFLLAYPYGTPSLMSSFAFDRATQAGRDAGPPSDATGHTNAIYAPGATTPSCAAASATAPVGSWVCEHRRPYVAPLLAFRKATAGADAVTNLWDDGHGQLAFGRGAKGFVVLNGESAALTRAFATSLPAGRYCDVYAGAPRNGACPGATVTVDAAGAATLTAAPMSAVVLHVGATL